MRNLKEAAKNEETDDREGEDIVLIENEELKNQSLYDKTFTLNDQTIENDTKSAKIHHAIVNEDG